MSLFVSERSSKPIALLVLATGVVAALMLPYIPIISWLTWPLRILTTLVHEGSHGLMAVVTGGSISSVIIRTDGSGQLNNFGGIRMLVLFAGYLGTGLFGFLLFVTATKVNSARTLIGTSGTLFILLVILYGRFDPFTLVVGIVAGIGFLAITLKAGSRGCMFAAAFLGTYIILNAIDDQISLFRLASGGHTHNDAAFMAQDIGLPAVFWASLWICMSLGFLWVGFRRFLSKL